MSKPNQTGTTYLQLAPGTLYKLPDGQEVAIYGIVRHRFGDVFLCTTNVNPMNGCVSGFWSHFPLIKSSFRVSIGNG
jgi:hypothetical protein